MEYSERANTESQLIHRVALFRSAAKHEHRPGNCQQQDQWRAAHGVVFLVMFGLTSFLPLARTWPWFWVLPLLAYYALALITPRLRRTLARPQIGMLTRWTLASTLSIAALSTVTLISYQWIVQPDLGELAGLLPIQGAWAARCWQVSFSRPSTPPSRN